MRKLLLALFFGFFGLVLLVSAPHSSFAEMHGCGCEGAGVTHGHMGMMFEARHRMIREAFRGLGLSGQQKEALRQIRSGVEKYTIRKEADIRIAKVELRDILEKDGLQKDQVDMNAVEAKLKEIASLQTDVRLAHIKEMQDVKSKLMPEQRTKFRENLERLRMHKGDRLCMNGCGEKKGTHEMGMMEHNH